MTVLCPVVALTIPILLKRHAATPLGLAGRVAVLLGTVVAMSHRAGPGKPGASWARVA